MAAGRGGQKPAGQVDTGPHGQARGTATTCASRDERMHAHTPEDVLLCSRGAAGEIYPGCTASESGSRTGLIPVRLRYLSSLSLAPRVINFLLLN